MEGDQRSDSDPANRLDVQVWENSVFQAAHPEGLPQSKLNTAAKSASTRQVCFPSKNILMERWYIYPLSASSPRRFITLMKAEMCLYWIITHISSYVSRSFFVIVNWVVSLPCPAHYTTIWPKNHLCVLQKLLPKALYLISWTVHIINH